MQSLENAILTAYFFFLITSVCVAENDTVSKNIDPKLAKAAEVVLRVERISPGIGSKYLWYDLKIIKVLANRSTSTFGKTISVAAYSSDDGIPPGISTIYLERYSKASPNYWRIVGGVSSSGVSHPTNGRREEAGKSSKVKLHTPTNSIGNANP